MPLANMATDTEGADHENGNEEQLRTKSIARYDEYYDYRTFSSRLKKTTKKEKTKNTKGAVLVVRRIIDEKGRFQWSEIDIKSPQLAEILLELNPQTENLKQQQPVTAYPSIFYHSRNGLKKMLSDEHEKEHPDNTRVRDLTIALSYIEEDYGMTIANMDSMLNKEEISWDLLWALFVPTSLVYHYHELTQQHQILRFNDATIRTRPSDRMKYYRIDCDTIVFDGKKIGYAKFKHFEIDQYPGARKIYDLPVFPLEFLKSKSAIYAQAVERGKRYSAIRGQAYMECNGPAVYEILNKDLKPKQFTFSAFGRAMIDAASFKVFRPNDTYNYQVYRQCDPDLLGSDTEYAICCPYVLGFNFGAKRWGGISLDFCRPINWSDEAFRSLVLESNKKKLIHSLVTQHTLKSQTFDDIVAGKGRGLVGLLSGRPGCGKTLTAEAISEQLRRPLYSVSAGELGTNPPDVDEQLTLVLELAQRWNAILLLDEADVFLQARNDTDVVRNALVSIFLRQIEYYTGIMILTTNRIGMFDAAFESRIHFSFHYPDLDFASRRKIWDTFLQRLPKGSDKDKHVFYDSQLDELAHIPLNGRQIKNLVSCAQSLALDEKMAVNMDHIQTALEVTSDWSKALAGQTSDNALLL